MLRLSTIAIMIAALTAGSADARRYRIIKIVRKPAPVQIVKPIPTVRVIPLNRWPLWCARIGGLDCP